MDLIIFLTDKIAIQLLPSIYKILESKYDSSELNQQYHVLTYESYEHILKELSLIREKNVFKKITLIFLSPPILKSQEIKNLRKSNAVICCFGDISQYYSYYYKITQFLFDGLIIFEPEYNVQQNSNFFL